MKMEKTRVFPIILLAVLYTSLSPPNDGEKEYGRNWLGLGKDGLYHVSKPGSEHTIEISFDAVVGEQYEVDIYYNGVLIENGITTSKIIKHIPQGRGKYIFQFFKVENGRRQKRKPEFRQGPQSAGMIPVKANRNGLRVTTSSSGTVTATVDA